MEKNARPKITVRTMATAGSSPSIAALDAAPDHDLDTILKNAVHSAQLHSLFSQQDSFIGSNTSQECWGASRVLASLWTLHSATSSGNI